jgi:uncharacterized membrane protein
MIRKLWPGLVAVGCATVFGIAIASQLPARVASHWDLHGQVNGSMSRTMLLLLLPVLALATAGILLIAPHLDPKRRNFPLHAGAYWIVGNGVLILLAAVHVFTLGYNLGWPINISAAIGVGVGLLLMVMGNVLTRVRPNWIFGVRTPWTLSSDRSWRETHRFTGYLFVLVGLFVLVTGFTAPHAVTIVLMVGVLAAAIAGVVYSYFAWKRDPDAQGRDG